MTTAAEPRERGILFSDRLVRAILEGRKTQTRRIVKTRPENHTRVGPVCHQAHIASPEALAHCPYGKPGDRLYVREAWATLAEDDRWAPSDLGPGNVRVWYRATDPVPVSECGKWRPSIHMPKWASRIMLEITGVRVERVQEIDWVDIRAEGVQCPDHDFPSGFCVRECPALRSEWERLWDQTNGHRDGCTWAANPWVWVIEFRRVEP